jgi:actin
MENLMNQGVDIDENYFEFVREIKEQMCEVAFDYEHALKSRDPLNQEQRSYELPDGKGIIEVNHKTRFNSTELLFNPIEGGHTNGVGVAELAYNAIEKCDNDLQIALFNNIVLAGGTTMLPGYKERFEHELIQLAGGGLKTDVNVTADLHRKYASWIGGSMIASLSTFDEMTIKASEYMEATSDKGSIVL